MTPERIDRTNDERLYQPPIHSRWIRQLHELSQELGEPMTVLLDRAISEYVEKYQQSDDVQDNQNTSNDY